MVLDAGGRRGPVHGSATHGLAGPEWQVGQGVTFADAFIQPGKLVEHQRLVIDDILEFQPFAGLQIRSVIEIEQAGGLPHQRESVIEPLIKRPTTPEIEMLPKAKPTAVLVKPSSSLAKKIGA